MTGAFALREHTADVAVEATGDSASTVFAAVADGLSAAQCDDVPATGGARFAVEREAEDLEGLLYDYLGRLIYERDVRGVLPVDNDVTISRLDTEGSDRAHDEGSDEAARDDARYRLAATARGVDLAAVDAREVKAVTFSQMVIEERGDEWYAYVVFDV
ncbi:archease [Halorubellus sp. PRR65]|uniref:archease n=1 Tax=Halorubellus sp. PRR65 TaxID=3098148 RepID=UPI002B25FABA|nr:archease [Halorubellus sp. PRR65]